MTSGASREISRPPSGLEIVSDRIFRQLSLAGAAFTLVLVVWIVVSIARVAAPAVHTYGFSPLVGTTWDANRAEFGILPAIWGTLYSSILGLIIGTVFGLAIAIFLSEGFLALGLDAVITALGLSDRPFWASMPVRIQDLLQIIIELLAAIPSVVYGLWGIFVIIPLVRPPADWLHSHLGWIPFFSTTLSGPGMLPAALVLAIMVLPTISAISRDALVAVPPKMREAAFGIGATRWEAILAIFVPTAATGIFGAIILGFGRALGRDDGARDAGGQRQRDQLVGVFAGQHARGVAGESFSGGGSGRGRRLDVCGAGAAGDHAGGQRGRHGDPPARRFPAQGAALMAVVRSKTRRLKISRSTWGASSIRCASRARCSAT